MWRWIELLPALTFTTCLALPEDAHRVHTPNQPVPRVSVVLIAIDGVRARDVFEGQAEHASGPVVRSTRDALPHLTTLKGEGFAWGERGELSASGPNFVSLPGYTEILTGRPATCFENDCEALSFPTLADDALALPGTRPDEVAVFSSWERIYSIAAQNRPGLVVSTGRLLTENRDIIDPGAVAHMDRARDACAEPGHGDYRPDIHTIDIAESYFEARRPRFLFVSLGDTDEHAHKGDFDGYWSALRRADVFIGRLRDIARARGEELAVVVTTDHGRAENFRDHGREHPESAETWVIAGGGGINGRGAGAKHLSDIAPMIRDVLRAPRAEYRAALSR